MEFEWSTWVSENHLMEKKNIHILVKEDLNNEKVLKPWTQLTSQKKLLLAAVKALTAGSEYHDKQDLAREDKDVTPNVTTKTLAKDQEINALLDAMGESHLKDLFNLNSGAGLNGPHASSRKARQCYQRWETVAYCWPH